MSPPPCDPPFRAPFMLPWALDTQAASVLSRSSKLGTGGPVWPGISPNLSADAQSVPSPNLLITSPPEIWSLPIPRHSWSHVGVNFTTYLPNSDGFTCIPVVVDRLSKACKLIPLRGLPTALETTEALFPHVFRNYRIPEDIVSDRGPEFIYHVWKAFLRLQGVSVSLSSGYHPQTNGQTERKIHEIGRYLWAYCHDNQHSWNHFLPWAECAQNSLRQTTTGLTPFQCQFPSQPPRPARTQRLWPVPSLSCRRGYCQGVTVTSVTTSYTHQIQLT